MRTPYTWTAAGLRSAIYTFCLTILITVIGKGSITASMISTIFHVPSVVLALSTMATMPAEKATQVTVLRASTPAVVAPPGSTISIQVNFEAQSTLAHDASLVLFLVDPRGAEVTRAENNLNNTLTILPTSRWVGPISVLSSMTVPKLSQGLYSIMAALYRPTGPVQLTAGPDVTQDTHYRYKIGTVRVDASAPPPALLPAKTLDLRGYHLTLNESFEVMSISDSKTHDGSRWYAKNEECCMSTTDGTSTAMVGVSSPQNPFSLIPGGGLNIRLQRTSKSWTSGVITSVDSVGEGFSQQYGYFEMKAKFPHGEDTWPAFWLLNTASKQSHAPAGEIDVVEYIANPHFANYISTTLHDWSNHTAPAASHHRVPSPTSGFHTYGMMWTPSTMTFYFDSAVTMRCPTPSIMKQPYYLLVDLGIGSGWPTENTPHTNDLQIQYIHAYSE
jgi:Glycosyl hydrolases family 16